MGGARVAGRTHHFRRGGEVAEAWAVGGDNRGTCHSVVKSIFGDRSRKLVVGLGKARRDATFEGSGDMSFIAPNGEGQWASWVRGCVGGVSAHLRRAVGSRLSASLAVKSSIAEEAATIEQDFGGVGKPSSTPGPPNELMVGNDQPAIACSFSSMNATWWGI